MVILALLVSAVSGNSAPGWYLSGPGNHCAEGCANVGLTCSEQTQYEKNAFVDSDAEMRALLSSLGYTASVCRDNYGSNEDVPCFYAQTGDCWHSHPNRALSTFSCYAQQTHYGGANRLCYCDNSAAVSAGDPHIRRFDGTAFDIDTDGSYSLFDVAGGRQFSVKSTVAPEHRGWNSKYNMKCEFGGSWLHGQNVTAAGHADVGAGIYFDGHFVSISNLLHNTSQYTREFTGQAKMILEICSGAGHMSDYCTSMKSLRHKEDRNHAYMTMVTDAANITVRYSRLQRSSHLDIYTRLQKNADSTQIGGLLAGAKTRQSRGDSPLLASSVGAVQE